MPARTDSWFQVLPDLDDLHGVRAAGLADRLADGEDDDIALLHYLALHQHLLRLAQQLLAVVADILDHQRRDVAEQRAAVARRRLRGKRVDRHAGVEAAHPERGRTR